MDFELQDKIFPEHLKELFLDMVDSKTDEPLNQKYINLPNLSKNIKSNLKTGLPKNDDISERTFFYGQNTIVQPPLEPIWKLFLSTFADPMLIILIILSIISILLETSTPLIKFIQNPSYKLRRGEIPFYFAWIEGFSILLAVFIVSIVSTINDYQKELKFKELSNEGNKYEVKVIRGGEDVNIQVEEVVVGDVVRINAGDKIPADGILIKGYSLKVDESSHSGEGKMVKKNEKKCVLISGTQVNNGHGTMLVVAVGKYSRYGEMMEGMLKKPKKKEETPLQIKLDDLSKKLSILAFFSAFVALFVLFVGAFVYKFIHKTWVWRWNPTNKCENANYTLTQEQERRECASIFSTIEQSITFIIFAVVLIVAAVPEGLPLAVTISLAYSVKLMLKDKNLVRKLVGCETMGSVTTICSDKTGTLTQNEQHVVDTWIAGKKFHVSIDLDLPLDLKDIIKQIVIEGISLNSTANLIEKDQNVSVQGSKTESALLFFLRNNFRVEYKTIRSSFENDGKIIKVFTFSSQRKCMSTVVSLPNGLRLYCKGAYEVVLAKCTKVIDNYGKVFELTDEMREHFHRMSDNFSSNGLRVLSLAFRKVHKNEIPSLNKEEKFREQFESDLVLYQIVGIKDPLRKNVVESVSICQRAGIKVKMVTGDGIETAKFIARECGILSQKGICMEGNKFRNTSDEDLLKILPKLEVLARSSPTDKLRLVEILQRSGEVVSVTGDGTNDAPALQKADVGLSMGIIGTQVAKAASDIIILDDDFSSIVKTVLWGRSINDNIRKFLQFQLTVNFVACIFSVICALTNFVEIRDSAGETIESEIPFTAIQLLWVNLIMDTLAALALATEKPAKDILNRPPVSKNEFFINWNMWVSIFVQTAYQLIVLLIIHIGSVFVNELRVINYGDFKNAVWTGSGWEYLSDPETSPYKTLVKDTLLFNTFVFMQIFNEINCRRINLEWNIFQNIHKNFMWLLIFFGTIIIQVIVVQIGVFDYGNMIFQTTGLMWFQWLISLGFGIFGILIHFLKNIILRSNRYFINKEKFF